jgi:hypothetical protein
MGLLSSTVWTVIVVLCSLGDAIDCGSNFSIAPKSELPFSYMLHTYSLSWSQGRALCKDFHAQCDLAVISRSAATLQHIQNTMDVVRQALIPEYMGCGVVNFGLHKTQSSQWYWVDGVAYNPNNKSDPRYLTDSIPYQGSDSGSELGANIVYRRIDATWTDVCGSWYGTNVTDSSYWSMWEMPRNSSCFQLIS